MVINKNNIVVYVIVTIACALVLTSIPVQAVAEEEFATEVVSSDEIYTSAVVGYDFNSMPYKLAGYANVKDYWEDLISKRSESAGIAEEAISAYGDVITDEQISQLREYEAGMLKASNVAKYNENLDKFNAITAECDTALSELMAAISAQQAAAAQVQSVSNVVSGGVSYTSNSGGLTKSGGINYYNGRTETYYSSNVLYHYMTSEWTVGSDGVYRDADGYVVVASSDLSYGSTVDTSLGEGKVYDSGCAPGVSDIYVNW